MTPDNAETICTASCMTLGPVLYRVMGGYGSMAEGFIAETLDTTWTSTMFSTRPGNPQKISLMDKTRTKKQVVELLIILRGFSTGVLVLL